MVIGVHECQHQIDTLWNYNQSITECTMIWMYVYHNFICILTSFQRLGVNIFIMDKIRTPV